MNLETCIRLRAFSNLLLDAIAIVDRCYVKGREARSMGQLLTDQANRFEHFRKPMPLKPEGTRFKVPQPPTAAELEAAGLSAESLPQLLGLIESAEHQAPQTEGATSILRQMKLQGSKEEDLSKVGSALALVEVLDSLSFSSFRLHESTQAK
jgi:hypothetical protein